MGFVLATSYQDEPLKNTVISSPTSSKSIRIGRFEGPWSIQIFWENGVTVDMDISLQVSNDGVHWDVYGGSSQNITGNSGSHSYEFIHGCGFENMKIVITPTTGSATFTALVNGRSRQ